jgi:cytochrome b
MTEPAPATVRLWDPLIRLCHWSLAIAFFANWFFTEEGEDWHQWLGYWAGAAALLRVGCEHCVDGSRNAIWATQRSEPW